MKDDTLLKNFWRLNISVSEAVSCPGRVVVYLRGRGAQCLKVSLRLFECNRTITPRTPRSKQGGRPGNKAVSKESLHSNLF